jgi:hypothetical protein
MIKSCGVGILPALPVGILPALPVGILPALPMQKLNTINLILSRS